MWQGLSVVIILIILYNLDNDLLMSDFIYIHCIKIGRMTVYRIIIYNS